MSTSIFDKMQSTLGTREDLAQYVRRVLSEKRMSLRDVQRKSGGRITQAYVGAIIHGSYSNLSVEKLKALSCGLGVDEDEVFSVARGVSNRAEKAELGKDAVQMVRLLELMRKVVVNDELMSFIEEVADMSLEEQTNLLRAIRSICTPRTKNLQRNNRIS